MPPSSHNHFLGTENGEEKPASLFLPLSLSISEEIPSAAARAFNTTQTPLCPVAAAPRPQRKQDAEHCWSAFGIPSWSGFLSKQHPKGQAGLFSAHSPRVRCVVDLPRGRPAVGGLQIENCSLVRSQQLLGLWSTCGMLLSTGGFPLPSHPRILGLGRGGQCCS